MPENHRYDKDNVLHYLRSIHRAMKELGKNVKGNPGNMLGTIAFHDDLDWLDCFIDAAERHDEVVLGPPVDPEIETHGLDTAKRICFYEQDHYYLSNFSAFRVVWEGMDFDTSEAACHWQKFKGSDLHSYEEARRAVRSKILHAISAHEAFKVAQENKALVRDDWRNVKVMFMHDILVAKACQHEYVLRKLLATGDRELVENSWRDDYWGWGPNKDGENMLGKLWMRVRAEMRDRQGSAV